MFTEKHFPVCRHIMLKIKCMTLKGQLVKKIYNMYISSQPKINFMMLCKVRPHKECSYCSKVLNLHYPLYMVSPENYIQFRCNTTNSVVVYITYHIEWYLGLPTNINDIRKSH